MTHGNQAKEHLKLGPAMVILLMLRLNQLSSSYQLRIIGGKWVTGLTIGDCRTPAKFCSLC